MIASSLYYHAREFPSHWRDSLREIDPIRESTSYLEPVWHVLSQRWVLYNMVPLLTYDEEDRKTFWQEVNGPDPETLEAGDTFLSGVQWRLWKTHQRIAEPYWILQGSNGGHLVRYNSEQKHIAKAAGLPSEPPKPGALPYCGWDHKAAHQIKRGNLLLQAGNNLARFMYENRGEGLRARKREAAKQYRASVAQWLGDAQAEAMDHYLRAMKKDELPISGSADAPDWEREEERATANFIETGTTSGFSDVKTT